jgi:hypothetical protein
LTETVGPRGTKQEPSIVPVYVLKQAGYRLFGAVLGGIKSILDDYDLNSAVGD